MRVVTIYPAFQGEVNKFGIGRQVTFIRLAGCNLRCYRSTMGINCDTPESLKGNAGEAMAIKDIIARVNQLNNKLICLTGGEPLIHEGVGELIYALRKNGCRISIESNGTQPIEHYKKSDVFFVLDYKSKSTGHPETFCKDNLGLLTKDDFVKFVLYDEKDFEEFIEKYKEWRKYNFRIAVGLFWGAKISYRELFNRINTMGLRVDLNMQTHKMMELYDTCTQDKDLKERVKVNFSKDL